MARKLAKTKTQAEANKFNRVDSTRRRVNKPANDNRTDRLPPTPKVTLSRLLNPANDNQFSGTVTNNVAKGVAVAKAISATWLIIILTGLLYLVQLYFAILAILGLGGLIALDNSWLYYADFLNILGGSGEFIMLTGMILTFVMGALSFIIALFIFLARGVNFGRSLSIFVAPICLSLYVLPGFNLFPWIWVWCLYVVKSQKD